MTRSLLIVLLLSAGCATTSVIDQARKQYNEGRGDEALQLLADAMKREPGDARLRGEYFRLRDTLVGQWLAQAEVLRQAGDT